mmetsp:Transcript_38101/g.82836  ORF Transcript_38101/g.82836 Transcript_38101/m.82836 type:complete len:136 (+) Transcript_38101:214-621(+)|eukprot:CAMPEP_0118933092 /NCGR_PEP_ID=MMETSP1169-20130426/11267_1 /TAXON_ID=36882 /ORGANISM="Pyramimonas obovata, Strain CCMP722" /LENGTH=135 /DNA_ID=CAMNT_0006875815 /DNA_START=170 /DNA_END=577 /DNA_ORIENTATION=-
MATIFSLVIINKSGGLIFQKDFTETARVDTNEAMTQASIWHSLHAISAQLSPAHGDTGIEMLEADTFNLHCFLAPTGTKFVLTCAPRTAGMEVLLQTIYELYSDYVLKNPFYEMEMPIRCAAFDQHLLNEIRSRS